MCDVPASSTFDLKGVQTDKIRTTGHEKLLFTAVLTAEINVTGNELKAVRLPPMIIFKNLVKPPPGNFPAGLVVRGTKGGTMTGELMANSYANDLWRKRPGSFFQQPKSLLIMDSARAHICHESIEALEGTNCMIIDGGMIPLLQFLDTHVNKPLKDQLREKWSSWMTDGEIQYTTSG